MLGLILVNSTFGVASIILAESSLDFLGFGLQAPTVSWGDTLASGEGYLDIAWWLTLFPQPHHVPQPSWSIISSGKVCAPPWTPVPRAKRRYFEIVESKSCPWLHLIGMNQTPTSSKENGPGDRPASLISLMALLLILGLGQMTICFQSAVQFAPELPRTVSTSNLSQTNSATAHGATACYPPQNMKSHVFPIVAVNFSLSRISTLPFPTPFCPPLRICRRPPSRPHSYTLLPSRQR